MVFCCVVLSVRFAEVSVKEVAQTLKRELSPAAYATFALAVRALVRLAAKASVTKMTPSNLAVCWSTAFFRSVLSLLL